jgi:hypothetical protein
VILLMIILFEIVNSGKYKNLNISVTDGGLPSIARNNGASLCTYPIYIILGRRYILDRLGILQSNSV